MILAKDTVESVGDLFIQSAYESEHTHRMEIVHLINLAEDRYWVCSSPENSPRVAKASSPIKTDFEDLVYLFLVLWIQCGAVARCSCYSSSPVYQPTNHCASSWICHLWMNGQWKTSSMTFKDLRILPVKLGTVPPTLQLIAAHVFQRKMFLLYMQNFLLK